MNTGGITIPAVVFNADISALTPETLVDILKGFRGDDVFREGFTKNTVLVAQAKSSGCGEPTNNLPESLTALLDSWSSTLLFILPEDEGIPQGP